MFKGLDFEKYFSEGLNNCLRGRFTFFRTPLEARGEVAFCKKSINFIELYENDNYLKVTKY